MFEGCSSSIYVFGSAAGGALGCQDKQANIEVVPRQLAKCCANLLQQETSLVINVIAGNGTTMIITSEEKAYSWGDSPLKNCALKTKRGTSCQCNCVPLNSIVKVAHGTSHVIAVTENSEVYGWGEITHCYRSKSASLAAASGKATTCKATKPRKLRIDFTTKQSQKRPLVNQVACGNGFSCLLQNDGTLITLGRLGIGASSTLNNIRFQEISCGQNHIAAICNNFQRVYTWVSLLMKSMLHIFTNSH
jgi:alpha-tubulin suppressor-like RCC1 family protein